MQPMPQSICAIVCIYVYFGPTQRLLPGVIITVRYSVDQHRCTENCGPFFSTLITSRRTPYRLLSRSSILDHPRRVTVLLDNFWHIKTVNRVIFLYQCYVGFRRLILKMFFLISWNFLVLPVTDSCLLPELIRTHSYSFTPKTFVYSFYNTGSSTKEMASLITQHQPGGPV